MELRILSGGAAQGLVRKLQPQFERTQGCTVAAVFGAVGLMRDKLLAGEACDLVILSDALVRELAADGHVDGATARAIGAVKTGVAVRSDAAAVDVGTAQKLAIVLSTAGALYFPDPAKATAGIHFMKVLRQLGIADSHATRFRMFPNGATAMAALAAAPENNAVGCTQVTEILYTPGVRLDGLLPSPYELATTYTAAVCTRAEQPEAARALIALLCGDDAAALRASGGFEPA